MLSTQTLLQIHGYGVAQEVERKKKEQSDGTADALGNGQKEMPGNEPPGGDGKPGRSRMDDADRNSDPTKSMTGKQPKPSNPEGS